MNFTILVTDGHTPINSAERTARKHFRVALRNAGFEPALMGERGHSYGKYGDLSEAAREALAGKLPLGWRFTTYVVPEGAIAAGQVTYRDTAGRLGQYGGADGSSNA